MEIKYAEVLERLKALDPKRIATFLAQIMFVFGHDDVDDQVADDMRRLERNPDLYWYSAADSFTIERTDEQIRECLAMLEDPTKTELDFRALINRELEG